MLPLKTDDEYLNELYTYSKHWVVYLLLSC